MLSAQYAIVRQSLCPSVRRVDQSKTVEVTIMKFSPYGSPIPLVFAGKFHQEILTSSPSGGVKYGRSGESRFLALRPKLLLLKK